MADIGGLMKTVAPWLGAALTGNVPALATMAASAIGDALGLPDKTMASVTQVVSGATTEQMILIKRADHDFSVKMQELGFQHIQALETIDADDRKSAREREIAVKDKMPALIAIAALCGFFGILTALIFADVPASARDPLNIMLGSLATLIVGIGNYYFGSSRGLDRSADVLSKIAQMP